MNDGKQKVACVIRACSFTSSSANKISNTPSTNLESALPNLDVEYIDDKHQLIADSNQKNINNNEDHQLIDDSLLQDLSERKIDTSILCLNNLHHPMHGVYSQNEDTKLEKNVDASIYKRKKLAKYEPTSSTIKGHGAKTKVSKKRIKRQRQAFSDRIKDLQNLIPNHSHKKDHASILDDAAEYIKSLKLQNEMMMMEWSEESRVNEVGSICNFNNYTSRD